MNAKELTVLMVEPGKHPKVTTLKDDLDSLQKAVSIGADYQSLIEFVSLGNGDCIMCNEEGKLIGLDGNRRLYETFIWQMIMQCDFSFLCHGRYWHGIGTVLLLAIGKMYDKLHLQIKRRPFRYFGKQRNTT